MNQIIVNKFLANFLLPLTFILIPLQGAQARWFEIPSPEQAIEQFGHASECSGLDAHSINVFVWNIYKEQKPDFYSEFGRLSQGKDLLLLQEGYQTPDFLNLVNANSDYFFTMATSFIYSKKNIATGVVTASPVQPLKSQYLASPGKEIVGGTPKAVLLTYFTFKNSHETLLVANIHALNSVTSKTFAKHIDQVANVLKNHSGPAIFAGDFNTWSKKKLGYLQSKMQKIKMQSVSFSNGDERMKTFGHALDWIYTRCFSQHFTHVESQSKGSDHKALNAKLALDMQRCR